MAGPVQARDLQEQNGDRHRFLLLCTLLSLASSTDLGVELLPPRKGLSGPETELNIRREIRDGPHHGRALARGSEGGLAGTDWTEMTASPIIFPSGWHLRGPVRPLQRVALCARPPVCMTALSRLAVSWRGCRRCHEQMRALNDSSLPGSRTEDSEGRRRPCCWTVVASETPSTATREPGGHSSSHEVASLGP